MSVHRTVFELSTRGRGTTDVTSRVQAIVAKSAVREGLCNVFVHHTSASLILCENASPDVRRDLETFLAALSPDGDPRFVHTDEGADDMPAHVRAVLTGNSLVLPVLDGRCDLGTWQGVYLYEHRHVAHTRKVTVTVMG